MTRYFACVSILMLIGCGQQGPALSTHVTTPTAQQTKQIVMTFCGDCHAYPPPDSYPKGLWEEEVRRGFKFYADSGRGDLEVPAFDLVLDYYDGHAPENMELQHPSDVTGTGPVLFQPQQIPNPRPDANVAVADLAFVDNKLLISDMRHGNLWEVSVPGDTVKPLLVPPESHLCHIEFCAGIGNGTRGLMLTDLGSFHPEDHSRGRVLWLQDGQTTECLQGVGRVADAKIADFTGDGKPDMVVAVFGWRKTGQLLLLEQTDDASGSVASSAFKRRVLDHRHGCSHVTVVDLDNDGDQDLIALFSQEHERVVAFLNDGSGNFQTQDLFAADRPDYGFSCMHPVDLDGDGDQDLVLSNGDSMDSHLLRTFHSLQWLENQGDTTFQHHHIDNYPGAYGVSAADFDGDGDQDIAAVSMTWWHDVPFNSVVWYEQTEPGQFVRHNLDFSTGQHATLEVADFDQDGDPDIAVGEFEVRPMPSKTLCTIWWNQRETAASER